MIDTGVRRAQIDDQTVRGGVAERKENSFTQLTEAHGTHRAETSYLHSIEMRIQQNTFASSDAFHHGGTETRRKGIRGEHQQYTEDRGCIGSSDHQALA